MATISRIEADKDCLLIQFDGNKSGIQFVGRAALLARIEWARSVQAEVRMLLRIGEALREGSTIDKIAADLKGAEL